MHDSLLTPVDRDTDLPLGAQLARRLRKAIADGELAAGERLPSIRELAGAADVNVNTVRAVYGRLEDEGLLHSDQGRGTFVARERGARRELQRQIASLEGEVVRRRWAPGPLREVPDATGRLLSTEELREVRDALRTQVADLDRARAEGLRRLEEVERLEQLASEEERATGRSRSRDPGVSRSSSSLARAQVRWVANTVPPSTSS